MELTMAKYKIPIDVEMSRRGFEADPQRWHNNLKKMARREGEDLAMIRLGMNLNNSNRTVLQEYNERAKEIKQSVKFGYKATRSGDKMHVVGIITFEV